MKELNLTRPQAGRSSVMSVDEASAIVFNFNMADAHFGRSGSDLTIGFGAETQISIADFFNPGAISSLENIRLGNGEVVSAKEFLRVLSEDFNIETAADKASADGSGVSDYRDDGGDLLGGVNRLGQGDGLKQWSLEPGGREVSVSLAEAGNSSTEYAPPTREEPEPTPDYFVMIGYGGPLHGAAPTAFAMPMTAIDDQYNSNSCLAGKTSQQVDTSGWTPWIDPQTGEASGYYEFYSALGHNVLYNPETGYFGYFPTSQGEINEAFYEHGLFYDYFTYSVVENGKTVIKTGHVLYVDESHFGTSPDYEFSNWQEALEAYLGGGAMAESVARAMEDLADRIEWVRDRIAGYEADYAWAIEDGNAEYARDIKNNLDEAKADLERLQYLETSLPEVLEKLDEVANDLGNALANPGRTEGSESITPGYTGSEGGRDIDLGEGGLPLISYQFDQAGFEAFLDANPSYVTEVRDLNSVRITGTNGDDTLNLESITLGYGSSITLGGGDDELVLGGSGGASISTGDGNDSIHVLGELSGDWDWQADKVILKNTVDTGAGDDRITVEGAVSSIIIDTGSGNDVLVLGNGVSNSNIDMGAGNDIVKIDASNQDYGYWSYDRAPYDSVIDGGASEVDKDAGRLGDVLSFSAGDAKNWGAYFEGLSENGNTIKNFDALHLDLSNDKQDVLNLDSLLGQINGLQSEGQFSSIIITGDKDDMALLNSGAWTKGDTVNNLEGFEGQFAHYTGSVGGQEMDLYIAIQQSMQSIIT